MATLIVRLGDREIDRYKIVKTITTIGRDKGNDLIIENSSVSRVHARIRYTKRHYLVSDAGSRNGILVNGDKVNEYPLRFGDRVTVGKFEVEFSSIGDVSEHRLISVAKKDLPETTDIEETFAVKLTELKSTASGMAPVTRGPVPMESGGLVDEEDKRLMVVVVAISIVMAVGIGAFVYFMM